MIFKRITYSLLIVLACSCTGASNKINKPEIPVFKTDAHTKEAYFKFLVSNMDGLLHVVKGTSISEDKKTIQSNYLAENINDAYSSSAGLLKSKIIDNASFLEYVLPYRINSSSPESWRRKVWKQYGRNVIKNANSVTSLIDSCNLINDQLKKWFHFSYIKELEDTLSYSQLYKYKTGTCESMSNVAAYTLRALGVPVAIDFTPCWGNMAGGHIWNALILPKGRSIPFLGAEANIGSYEPLYLIKAGDHSPLSTFRKPGKVYRHVYTPQRNSVYYKYGHLSYFPPMDVNSRVIDVTSKYVNVANIILNSQRISSDPKLLYISNYNGGRWVPVMASERTGAEYRFSDMATDMLYYITTYKETASKSNMFAAYLANDGKLIKLGPSPLLRTTISLDRTQSIEADQMKAAKKAWDVDEFSKIARGLIKSTPKDGEVYRLYYFDKEWTYVQSAMAKKGRLVFKDVPSDALYLLCKNQPTEIERPFIQLEKEIKWL